jgi:hypothetical protein
MVLSTANICAFGWKARDFALKGVDGKTYSLAGARRPKGTLVVFICNQKARPCFVHEIAIAFVVPDIPRVLSCFRGCTPNGRGAPFFRPEPWNAALPHLPLG